MRSARRALFFAATGVLPVLALAWVFRGPLLKPLIVRTALRSYGLQVAIGEVGGSAIAGLDLGGVSARSRDQAASAFTFETKRLTVHYALLALLRGREAFLDSLAVTLDGARLDLDLAGKADDTPAAGQPASAFSLPLLPRLTVRDSQLRIRGRGYAIEADGLRGALGQADQAREQPVTIEAGHFTLRHSALREGSLSLSISGRYAARHLAIAAAQVNGRPLIGQGRLDFGELPGDLDLQLALRLWEGSTSFGMSRRATGVELTWDARGVDLQPQVLLANPALAALRGKLSCAGAVKIDRGNLSTLTGNLSLDWEGALLAGRAVDRLQLQGTAAAGVIHVARAAGRIGPNEILIRQAGLPAGPLFEGRWRELLAGSSGDFTAALGDVPAFLALWGVQTGGGARAVPGHLLRLGGSLEQGAVRLTRGDLATGLGKATLAGVTVSFPPADRGWGETSFGGSADVDIPDLRDLSALFPLPPLSGSIKGRVSGTGTVARPEGSASLTGRNITVAGKPLGDVDLKARGAAGSIEVEELEVRHPGGRLTARGVRFSPAALAAADANAALESLEGSFSLRSADLPALAALAGVPREKLAKTPPSHQLAVAGTVRGRTISLTTGSFAAGGGTITLRGARITLPPAGSDWEKDLAFAGDLDIDAPDLEPLARIFRLPPVAGALRGRAQLAGSPVAPTGSIEVAGKEIAFRGHRVGDVVARASAQQQLVRIETFEISRGVDRLRGGGTFDLEKRMLLEAEADVSLADVAPYVAEFVDAGMPVSGRFHAGLRTTGPIPGAPLAVAAEFAEGRVKEMREMRCVAEAELDFRGTLARPRLDMTARIKELSRDSGAHLARGSFEAAYEPGHLSIGAFELKGSRGITFKGEGSVPVDLAADEILRPGPLAIHAQASIPKLEDVSLLLPARHALAGTLTADLTIRGSWELPEARLEFSGEQLQPPPGTRFAPPGPHALSGILAWSAGEVRAEKIVFRSADLSLTASGAWSSPPSLRQLVSGQAGLPTGPLSARASFAAPDVAWLRESVEGLRGLRGEVSGEITAEGPARNPDLSGEIRVADAAFRHRDLPPVDRIAATVSASGKTVNLGEIRGEVGGAAFTLAGTIDVSRPADPTFELRLKGANALLYRAEGLQVRADSDLTLRGPFSALSLAGEVALTRSRYERSFSIASLLSGGGAAKSPKRSASGFAGISFPNPPLKNMSFDVRLTAREPFRVLTSAFQGDVLPDLRLTGTGLLPVLRGPVLVESARLILPSGRLEFERGTVLFEESELGRAKLDLGGRMELRGYDITAQVTGTLDEPEVILSSTPPMAQEELLLFVLTGAPPDGTGLKSGTVSSAATPMAVYFGANVLEGLFGAGSRSGGDGLQSRLELQIGREVTRSGSVTAEARLLLKKNPVARRSALYLTAEKDVYDQENIGLRLTFKFR